MLLASKTINQFLLKLTTLKKLNYNPYNNTVRTKIEYLKYCVDPILSNPTK